MRWVVGVVAPGGAAISSAGLGRIAGIQHSCRGSSPLCSRAARGASGWVCLHAHLICMVFSGRPRALTLAKLFQPHQATPQASNQGRFSAGTYRRFGSLAQRAQRPPLVSPRNWVGGVYLGRICGGGGKPRYLLCWYLRTQSAGDSSPARQR